jgi:hypothetical protein
VLGPRLRHGDVVVLDNLGAPGEPHRGGRRGSRRKGLVASTVLVRLQPHCAVLVKD